MTLDLDMYMTAGVGVVALLLGMCFNKWIPFLKRFCIPVPVSGGLLISLFFLLLYAVFGLDIEFDGTIKDIAMTLFFTSVGYQSNVRVLKQGGKPLVVMIVLVAVLIVSQNLLSLGIAKGMGVSSLVGMATGSIPMCGGHGTAGGFSPLLEKMGLEGADSITMAAATFGLIAGSLIGGPLGEMLIRRHKLAEETNTNDEIMTLEAHEGGSSLKRYTQALGQLFVAMALGMGLSKLLALPEITKETIDLAVKTWGSEVLYDFIRYTGLLDVKCPSRENLVPTLTDRIRTGNRRSTSAGKTTLTVGGLNTAQPAGGMRPT